MSEANKFYHYVKQRIGIEWIRDLRQYDRLTILKSFLSNSSDFILDVGCGEIEPKIVCDYTHAVAMDLASSGLDNLKKKQFKGHLVLGSCSNLPFKDRCFERAICSEVIEHLPTDSDVKRCIEELNRVSDRFMVTTPNNQFDFRWLEATHRRFFNVKNIRKFFPKKSKIITSNIPQASVPIPILPYFLLDKQETTIGRYLAWFDKKLRMTPIGLLSRKFKSKLLGGAFIIAIYKSGKTPACT